MVIGFGCGDNGTARVDAAGNILSTHSYKIDPVLLIQAVKRASDNEFILVSNYYYSTDTCYVVNGLAYRRFAPVVAKMDSMGNVTNARQYLLNGGCQNDASDLVITRDKGALVFSDGRSFFAMRVDSNLTHLWSKHFEHHGGVQFIKELPNGDLLAGINMDTAGASLARLDADGNFLWCKSYIPKGIVQDCVVESDTSFIVTGYTDSLVVEDSAPPPPDYHPKMFMMKLNGAGVVQWCKGYEVQPQWYTTSGQKIVKTLDGNYALQATTTSPQGNFGYRPFLMKTNTNGDTLWTRSAGADGYTYLTYDLVACSDGGFLLSGVGLYLFKADSLGHLPCSEKPAAPMVISDLFPVDSNFTLLSLDGAVSQPVLIQDTVYPTVVTYDGCTITNTHSYSTTIRIQAHPNPNTGHFTLTFKDPLQAESYYSVYDAAGKLLYQRPLPTGKGTEEVDLSRYGKGTYVIKCTDKEGVYHEQVVVE